MINCGITEDYMFGCAQMGGIKNVWLVNWERFNITKDAEEIVTAVESVANPMDPITRYYVGQKANWAGLSGAGVYNEDNDTVYTQDTLMIKLSGWLAKDRNLFAALRRGAFAAIVESNMGVLYVAGLEIAGKAVEDTNGPGATFEERNGGTISLRFDSADGAYILNKDSFDNDFADYVAPVPVS